MLPPAAGETLVPAASSSSSSIGIGKGVGLGVAVGIGVRVAAVAVVVEVELHLLVVGVPGWPRDARPPCHSLLRCSSCECYCDGIEIEIACVHVQS